AARGLRVVRARRALGERDRRAREPTRGHGGLAPTARSRRVLRDRASFACQPRGQEGDMSDDVTRDEFAQSDDDRAFERLLLRSASYDGPPPGAGAAAFAALVRAGGEAAIFEGAASGVAAKAAASKAL